MAENILEEVCVDDTVIPGKTYYYTLRSVDPAGNQRASSPIPITIDNYPWFLTRQLGTTADDIAYGVAVDGNGNVYVTGTTYGGLDGNTNAGGGDPFLIRYASNGNKIWTRQPGTATGENAKGVAVDRNGNVYVTGIYTWRPGWEPKCGFRGSVPGQV